MNNPTWEQYNEVANRAVRYSAQLDAMESQIMAYQALIIVLTVFFVSVILILAYKIHKAS